MNGTSIGKVFFDMTLNKKDFDSKLKESEKQTGKLDNTIANLGSTISKVFGAAVIGNFIKNSVEETSKLESAMIGLQSIMDGQERSFADAKVFINDYVKDGLLPATNAITAYKNLAARGYSDDQITQTLQNLKDAAAFGRQGSLSLGDAVQSATEGLKNENSILVDNAGVTKNVSVMWEEYATSIGTTVDNLTKAQKIQAEVNGIMVETQFQVGDAAKLTATYSGQVSKLSAGIIVLRQSIGNVFLPLFTSLVGAMNVGVQAAIWLTNAYNGLNPVFKAFVGGLVTAAVIMPIISVGAWAIVKAKMAWAVVTGFLTKRIVLLGGAINLAFWQVALFAGAVFAVIKLIKMLVGGSDATAKSTVEASKGVNELSDSIAGLEKSSGFLADFDKISNIGSDNNSNSLLGYIDLDSLEKANDLTAEMFDTTKSDGWFTKLTKGWASFSSNWSKGWTVITEWAKTKINGIGSSYNNLINWWTEFRSNWGAGWTSITNWAKTKIGEIGSAIKNIPSNFSALTRGWDLFGTNWKKGWDALIKYAKDNPITDKVSETKSNVKELTRGWDIFGPNNLKGLGIMGDAISDFFSFKAKGGPVSSNSPYIVGEQGPELFVPSGNGSIMTNSKTNDIMSGGSSNGSSQMNNDRPLNLTLMVNDRVLGQVTADSINRLSAERGEMVIRV